MRRHLGTVLCVALAAFALQSAIAQQPPPTPTPIPVAVDPPPPPLPEAHFRGQARIDFLEDYVQTTEVSRGDRDRAYRRLVALHERAGNGRAQRDWSARHRAFVLSEANIIEPDLIASPVSICTPPAEPLPSVAILAYCAPDAVADLRRADDWDLLGRAYALRGDEPRRIAALEAETLLRRSRMPEDYTWIALAREAIGAGQYEDALRYCNVTVTAPVYIAYPNVRTRSGVAVSPSACAADVNFLMGNWQVWLSHYEPLILGPDLDTENITRLCVAATHLNRAAARDACDWAAASISLRDEDEQLRMDSARNSARERRNAGLFRDATELVAQMRLNDWEQDKARLNAAIRGCRRGTDTCRLAAPPANRSLR